VKARLALPFIMLSAAGLLWTVAAAKDPPLLVGVIEDVESTADMPAMSTVHVRAAFQKQGSEWLAFEPIVDNSVRALPPVPRTPGEVKWTVVFDGRRIGSIVTEKLRSSDRSSDKGVLKISSDLKSVPKLQTGAGDFALTAGRMRSRPLLIVTAPNFRDPDHWMPTTLSAGERQIAITEFRRRFPTMEQCDEPESKPIHMIAYRDEEILFFKPYRARNGEVTFGLKLDDTRSKCGFFDDENFFDYWFVIDERHSIRILDSQMTPIDAADLDDDGHSEWVFLTSRGEDWDGYEIFYDDFDKKASFQWAYH
jgi:hypothetical protein